MDALKYISRKILATVVRSVLRLLLGNFPTYGNEVLHIPSRDSNRTIRTHVYRSNSSKPSPVLINWHGSGFMVPMHGSDDEFCRIISLKTDYTVIDASYRLSPENQFPAAPNDVEDVIKWVLARPEEFDLSRVALSGFSAGGNLALVASCQLFPKETFRHVIAVYPVTDLAKDPWAKDIPDKSGRPIPPWLSALFHDCYVPSAVDKRDPRISPAYASRDRFPASMMIITCACDTLCLEGEELARELAAIPGNEVVQSRMEKCDHGWDKSPKKGSHQEKEKDRAYDLVVQTLRK